MQKAAGAGTAGGTAITAATTAAATTGFASPPIEVELDYDAVTVKASNARRVSVG